MSLTTFYKLALKTVSFSGKEKHFLSSLFTCKCGCFTHRCFAERQQQQQGVLCFVRAIVLPPFSLCLSTCPLTIVQCAAYGDNRSHTHTHTQWYLGKMPLGRYLYFPDILHQTVSSTVFKARLLELINQTGVRTCAQSFGLTSCSLNCSSSL